MNALDSLDIESATASHKTWFQLFEQAILGINADKLADLSVGDDTKCVLGCWLHGPGQESYATLPLFQHIIAAHRAFHQEAQRIVDLLLAGEVEAAELHLGTRFREVSEHLTGLLHELSVRSH